MHIYLKAHEALSTTTGLISVSYRTESSKTVSWVLRQLTLGVTLPDELELDVISAQRATIEELEKKVGMLEQVNRHLNILLSRGK